MNSTKASLRQGVTLALVILFLFVGAGCGSDSAEKEALKTMNLYFDAVKAENYSLALSYFSPEFFKKTPPAEELRLLTRGQNMAGRLVSCELDHWVVNRQLFHNVIVTLYFKCEYEKRHSDESYTLVLTDKRYLVQAQKVVFAIP